MIRTAIVAIFLTVCVILLGPPLILYTLVARSAGPIYWVGVKAIVWSGRMAGMRVRAEGVENIPAGVCLFVANHTSNADAVAILTCLRRRIGIVARRSLFDLPIMGTAFRLANFVPVERGNRESSLGSARLATEHIKGGMSFLVYPEGTRSPDGRLRPFKKGSFAMAIEGCAPVVPVVCSGAQRILPKYSLHIRPGWVTVRFEPPIDTASYTVEQRGELARRTHDAIAAALPDDQKPAEMEERTVRSGTISQTGT